MTTHTNASSPASGTDAIHSLLTLLVANGWTIPQWSDGTTLTTPGSPLASNPYGSSGSGAGNLGNASAWFRVTSPTVGGRTREWIFQRGSDDQTWTIERSRLGYSGGSPDATTLPTDAASGQPLFSNAQVFDAPPGRWFISTDDTDGSWRGFTVPVGGGNVLTFLADEALAAGSYPSADEDPLTFMGYFNGGGWTPYGTTCARLTESSTAKLYKRVRHNLAGPSNVRARAFTYFIDAVGTFAPPQSSGTQMAPEPQGATEGPLPIPVAAQGATSTSTGWMGFFANLRWCSVYGRENGQTLNTGSAYYIHAAGIWCPWDSSTPTI